MVPDYLSVVIKMGWAILKFLPDLARKLLNYWKRPNLKFSVRNSHIEFSTNDEQRLGPIFPSIRIQNRTPKDITLDLEKLSVNGQSLRYIIQQNTYFLRTFEECKPEVKLKTSNELLNTFRENWTSAAFLTLSAHKYFDIPLFPQKMGSSTYFKILPDARVFFPNRKMVIKLTANSKEFHFGVNRIEFLKVIVNSLANECQR